MTPESTSDQAFVPWLLRQSEVDKPVGDLARDVKADLTSGCLQPSVLSADTLRAHLEKEHAMDPGAEDALKSAIRRWRRQTS